MSIDYETRERHLKRKAAELAGKPFLPKELVDFVVDVARLQLEATRKVQVIPPSQDQLPEVEENLNGRPLLLRQEFSYDKELALTLFQELLALSAKMKTPLAQSAKVLASDIKQGFDVQEAFAMFFQSRDEYFAEWAQKTPETPRFLSFLVRASLTPSIEALADSLNGRVPADRTWQHGHCPVCGDLPLISSLREKEGKRYATCSFCLTGYRIPRLACPFCGETDLNKLVYYDIPEEPGYRIDACETCKTYIKTADFRTLDKISVPVLDDLESLHLDFLAIERAYKRPTLSAWGF